MKRSVVGFVAVAAMVLGQGCSSTRQEQFPSLSSDFRSVNNEYLCGVYGERAFRADDARQELQRRGVFTPAEWQMIGAGRVMLGMSACAVKAAWGARTVRVTVVEDSAARKQLRQELTFDCKAARVPYCPFTVVDLAQDRVTEIRVVEHL